MSAYKRQPDDGIQAGLALNAGRLLSQYFDDLESQPPEKRYEATLTVCVLQTLLTNMHELLQRLARAQSARFRAPLGETSVWHLQVPFIKRNDFPGTVRVKRVIEHLRNAVSHPTSGETGGLPITGYTTPRDPSGLVRAFRFTDSPWVDRGLLHRRYRYASQEDALAAIGSFQGKYGSGVKLSVRREEDGMHVVTDGPELYVPAFVMEIPLPALVQFSKELANFLAQPVDEGWDGGTIQPLVA